MLYDGGLYISIIMGQGEAFINFLKWGINKGFAYLL
jgi:hypothetical protein